MQSAIRLLRLAAIWSEENGRSLPRLSTIVVNDGKLLSRIAGGGSCTIATFDRFLAFFADGSNWPNGIPEEVKALLHMAEEAA